MTEQELQYLRKSASMLELYRKAEDIRIKITRTFSEKSPHRQAQLEDLDNFITKLANTLPSCTADQLRRIEETIANASSLEKHEKAIEEYRPISDRIEDVRQVVERGKVQWVKKQVLREEEEHRRLVATQTVERGLASLEIDAKKAMSSVNHEDGQNAITAGMVIEALLRIEGFNAAASICSPARDRYLLEAARHVQQLELSLIREAAGWFANGDGTLIYMRHPASPPKSFFGLGQDFDSRPTGVLIRQLTARTFQAEHASRDRAEYGKQVDGRERFRIESLPSIGQAIAYIDSLGRKHWYTNFLHPDSPLSHATRYPYPAEEHRNFVSWKDRANQMSNL